MRTAKAVPCVFLSLLAHGKERDSGSDSSKESKRNLEKVQKEASSPTLPHYHPS
jgi:hypothetical protein